MADLIVTAANVLASSGPKEQGVAGEAISAGKALYKSSTSKKWMLADSNSGTAEARRAIAIALNNAALNQPVVVALPGSDIAIGATLTAGTDYYLSDTPGGICPRADVGSGESVCLLGLAKSPSVLAFNPQFPNVQL
ncbi:MAG: hypothetical protein ABTQ31_12805 [Rhizobiaceae bacterium]